MRRIPQGFIWLSSVSRFSASSPGTPSSWSTSSNLWHRSARSTYVPVFEVDTDDPARVSARIEPYFWDPVTAVLDEEDRACAMGRLTAFRSVRTIISSRMVRCLRG